MNYVVVRQHNRSTHSQICSVRREGAFPPDEAEWEAVDEIDTVQIDTFLHLDGRLCTHLDEDVLWLSRQMPRLRKMLQDNVRTARAAHEKECAGVFRNWVLEQKAAAKMKNEQQARWADHEAPSWMGRVFGVRRSRNYPVVGEDHVGCAVIFIDKYVPTRREQDFFFPRPPSQIGSLVRG